MAAITKDICILDISEAQAGFVNIRVIFWLQVSAPFPSAAPSSSYPNINTDPNTSGIFAAIQSGTVIEEVYTFLVPVNWIALQWTIVESLMLAFLNARKAVHAGTLAALPDRGLKFAVMHDSASGWTA